MDTPSLSTNPALPTTSGGEHRTDDHDDCAFGMEAALPYLMAGLSADIAEPAAVL